METFKGILGAVFSSFKSKRVWVIVILFVTNGIAGVSDQIPVDTLHHLDIILGLLGVWFGVPTMKSKE